MAAIYAWAVPVLLVTMNGLRAHLRDHQRPASRHGSLETRLVEQSALPVLLIAQAVVIALVLAGGALILLR